MIENKLHENKLHENKLHENKVEVDQNFCVICLENVDTVNKSDMFNCNCSVFFHEKCWLYYIINKNIKCPYCRKNIIFLNEPFLQNHIVNEQVIQMEGRQVQRQLAQLQSGDLFETYVYNHIILVFFYFLIILTIIAVGMSKMPSFSNTYILLDLCTIILDLFISFIIFPKNCGLIRCYRFVTFFYSSDVLYSGYVYDNLYLTSGISLYLGWYYFLIFIFLINECIKLRILRRILRLVEN